MENLANFVSDVRDINQMNPDTIARLTSQVSSLSASMFDVSNLKKSSHLSASSPNLAAASAGGLLAKFGRKKSKVATSKTHLLKSSDGLDNAGFVQEGEGGLNGQVSSGLITRAALVYYQNCLVCTARWYFILFIFIQGCFTAFSFLLFAPKITLTKSIIAVLCDPNNNL